MFRCKSVNDVTFVYGGIERNGYYVHGTKVKCKTKNEKLAYPVRSSFSFYILHFTLINPLRNKYVSVPCAAVVPVAAKNNFLSVRAEHGEGIEAFVTADLYDIASISIHHIHVKREAALVLM